MKTTKILTICVLAFGLILWPASMASGDIFLLVNGVDVESITLEVGESRSVEVFSTDDNPYEAFVGFDDGLVLGSFMNQSTMPEAGNLASVLGPIDEPEFYGYDVLAAGFAPPPSFGIHFVFAYEAQEAGETDLKLYDDTLTAVIDSVHITVPEPFVPEPMGTAFTYQGHLYDANHVADGEYDFQFKLFDSNDPCEGSQVGIDVNKPDVDVIEGYFVVELDFGGDVFFGEARWLEIGVRPGEFSDPCDYTILEPRLELTPVPYALWAKDSSLAQYANDANSVDGYDSSAFALVGHNHDASYALIGHNHDGVYALIGHDHDTRYYTQTQLNTGGGGAQVHWDNLNSVPAGFADGIDDVGGGDSDWIISDSNMYSGVSGNVGIGTTSPGAKLTVNGAILRDGSTMYGLSADTHINLGTNSTTGKSGYNCLYATVGGGYYNAAIGDYATVAGGYYNTATGYRATVGGGETNEAIGSRSTVGGGLGNTASGQRATVGGGYNNSASGNYATVPGGRENDAGDYYSTVGGGRENDASGWYATVPGGGSNEASGFYSFAAGRRAKANHNGTFVWADSTDANFASTGNDQFLIRASGGVGIGTNSPGAKLDVAGTAKCQVLEITGGADIAEPFDVKQADVVKAGMVLSVDPENAGKLKISEKAYDYCVAGIISGAGGLEPGMLMGQKGTKADGEHPVALTGRVYALVDATYGAVEPGDLLTTSATPGYAMKATDRERSYGAVIGKAMSSLEEGKGLVLVLVTLQ